MNQFSILIITYNEEKIIGRCIDAASKISNDIVIVDAYSEDKTVEIAKSKGANVFLKKWEGYSEAKNFGAGKCKNDWIISLDADEIVSEEFIRNIKKVKPVDNIIYQINIKGNFLGKWIYYSGWYPSWKKRIYNKKYFFWNDAVVHESLVGKIEFDLKKIKGDILHYSYDNPDDVSIKSDRYAKLLAKSMVKNNNKPSMLKRLLGSRFKFINTYLFKLGFLDGRAGFRIAKMNAEIVKKKIYYYDLYINDPDAIK